MAAIEEFLADAKRRMDKSIEATHHEFNSIRTGRASPALLDRITIDYYGTQTPLKSLASIGAPEARMLTVQPFDPGSKVGTPVDSHVAPPGHYALVVLDGARTPSVAKVVHVG